MKTVKQTIEKRIKMFTNEIMKEEDSFNKTNERKHQARANNFRARRGELQVLSKIL